MATIAVVTSSPPFAEGGHLVMARELVREQKADDAINAWTEEVRNRAFVELREAPQP